MHLADEFTECIILETIIVNRDIVFFVAALSLLSLLILLHLEDVVKSFLNFLEVLIRVVCAVF